MEERFRRLTDFYLGCIQEEGLRRLTLKESWRGQAFVAPTLSRERLLHEELETLQLERLSRRQQDFIEEAAGGEGPSGSGRESLFYGFPTWVGPNGRVASLFFREVEVEKTRGGDFRLVVDTGRPKYVNSHLFRREGYSPEQIVSIQEEIEGKQGFSSQLATALRYVEGGGEAGLGRSAEQFPKDASPGLYAAPILFESTYSSYTYNLERDLRDLRKYGFLREGVSQTALGPLLSEGISGREEETHQDRTPAEVLPLNDEQEEAVTRALEAPLSAVTGPPGTGKSQVVVNLLAEAALSGEPVLFASKNNKAVDVVRERLRGILGEELDFTLRLGAKSKRDDLKSELRDRFERLEKQQEHLQEELSVERETALEAKTDRLRDTIEELKGKRDAWRQAKQKREETGNELPDEWIEPEPPGSPEALPIAELRRSLDRARMLAGEEPCGIFLWLRWALMGGRLLEKLRNKTVEISSGLPGAVDEDVYVRTYSAEDFSGVLEVLRDLHRYRVWTERRAKERQAKQKLKEALGAADSFEAKLETLKESLSKAYQELLRVSWGGQIIRNLSVTRRRVRDYFRAIDKVESASPSEYREALDELESAAERLSEYLPIWIVTNLSVRNALPLRPGLFDLAVVDEASQCDVASAVPLLYRARRSVVIGDQKQLRHITQIMEDVERGLAQESGAEGLLPAWSYVERSLYDRGEGVLSSHGARPTFLRRHYRSHPDVIGFSNDRFYQGRLEPMRDGESFAVPERWKGVRWWNVEGEVPTDIQSAYNKQEVRAVLRLLKTWKEQGVLGREGLSVGVVTPFSAQEEMIQNVARGRSWWQDLDGDRGNAPVTVGTIHKYQGDERDLMIFSPVVAPGMREYTEKWVAGTEQLLNVGITRARAGLHVVGHLDHCRGAGGHLGAFAGHVGTTHDFAELG